MKKWSIDFIVHLINITICNPFLTTLIPITMLTSTTLRSTCLEFRLMTLYVCTLWFIYLFRISDRFVRNGMKKTSEAWKWNDQVVVVTGGSSGLGSQLCSLISMRRPKQLYVLDISVPRDPIPGVTYILCDVSDVEAVRAAKNQIGTVTVFISNAGVVRSGTILETTSIEDVKRVMDVNFTAQYILTRQFLKDMKVGQWITVGSSLGFIGVHSLSIYCASKAATTAFHESLTAELAYSNPFIQTLLFLPGQIDTDMFRHIVNPSPFLGPTLDVLDLAKFIVNKIERQEAGEFGLPLYSNYLGLMRVLPSGLVRLIRSFSGVDQSAKDMINNIKDKGDL